MLGVHYLTVLRWAHETVAGRPMRITYVRRDSTGRYYVDEQEIRGIAERPQLEFF